MVDSVATEDRPMRSHARRNRERIIDVARTALADPDEDISLNEVARRAGVGIGTLFRHFPNREALLEALLHDRSMALCSRARTATSTPRCTISVGPSRGRPSPCSSGPSDPVTSATTWTPRN
jgi:AcrR family transcriptional regulator